MCIIQTRSARRIIRKVNVTPPRQRRSVTVNTHCLVCGGDFAMSVQMHTQGQRMQVCMPHSFPACLTHSPHPTPQSCAPGKRRFHRCARAHSKGIVGPIDVVNGRHDGVHCAYRNGNSSYACVERTAHLSRGIGGRQREWSRRVSRNTSTLSGA